MKDKKIIIVVILVIVAVALGIVLSGILRSSQLRDNANQTQTEQANQGQTGQNEESGEQSGGSGGSDEEQTATPAEIALAMSNHNDENLFLVHKKKVYYSSFDSEGRAMLVRSDLDGDHQKTIREDCDAAYLTEHDGALYMIVWTRDEGSALCRMDMDGSNFKELVVGAVDLQIVGDTLYYNKADTTNEYELLNGGYFNSELDGSGESQLLEKETYDNYVVDGKIYYQDEEDGQRIHVMDLETQEDKTITKTHSHGFVVDGEKAYYIDTGEDGDVTTGNLTEMDLETGDTKVLAGEAYKDALLVREHTILYCDGENNYHISQIDKGESGKKELADIDNPDYLYAADDKVLFFDYDWNWQYVEGVYCINGDGSGVTRLDE